MDQQILICTKTDKEFSSQLTAILDEQTSSLIWAADMVEWADALDRYFPKLALLGIDPPVHRIYDHATAWRDTLRRIKLLPHTKYVPVVAFSKCDTVGLAAAKGLGAEETWQITSANDQLLALIQRYLDPPVRYLDGWDDVLPDLAQKGLHAFNQGDYFEQHELLEDAWRAEARPIRDLYQGILQIGVAFYQIERGNWKGAIKTFRRGLPKLRDLPSTCQGVDLATFRATAEQIHADLTQLGPRHLAQFDQSRLPLIHFDSKK